MTQIIDCITRRICHSIYYLIINHQIAYKNNNYCNLLFIYFVFLLIKIHFENVLHFNKWLILMSVNTFKYNRLQKLIIFIAQQNCNSNSTLGTESEHSLKYWTTGALVVLIGSTLKNLVTIYQRWQTGSGTAPVHNPQAQR